MLEPQVLVVEPVFEPVLVLVEERASVLQAVRLHPPTQQTPPAHQEHSIRLLQEP